MPSGYWNDHLHTWVTIGDPIPPDLNLPSPLPIPFFQMRDAIPENRTIEAPHLTEADVRRVVREEVMAALKIAGLAPLV